MSIVDNIQLPPTLLSRFDLIYLILDKPEEVKDKKLAHHIVSLYYEVGLAATRTRPRAPRLPSPTGRTSSSFLFWQNRETQQPEGDDTIDRETLAHYISFARKHIHPAITEEASRALING